MATVEPVNTLLTYPPGLVAPVALFRLEVRHA